MRGRSRAGAVGISSRRRNEEITVDTPTRPAGIEIIFGCLIGGHGPVGAQAVLDHGCGSGNYTKALSAYVGGVHALAWDTDSLDQTRRGLSLEIDAGQVDLHEATPDEIPYEDASFDAVLLSHGFGIRSDSAAAGWPGHQEVLAEVQRVVAPGGMVIVRTSSRRQLEDAFWHHGLLRRAADEMTARYAPVDTILSLLPEANLEPAGCFVPLHEPLHGPDYLQPLPWSDTGWIENDPTWLIATEEEREDAAELLAELSASDALAEFISTNDAQRPVLGQATFVVGRRPRS